MDKHICKAKSVFDGKWVYGYYVAVPFECEKELAHLIIEQDAEYIGCGEFKHWNVHRVDPDTVCRCTEMTEFVVTDESVNAPLFDGDIVEVWSRRRPIGENITLYRNNTTSQYDIEVKARAVICFKHGEWQLDYDNAYNDAICELKRNEQTERTIKANPSLYGFNIHYNNKEWFIEHNHHCKRYDIVRIGNIYDNPELLEG
jgi:hypothetical protein